LIAAVVFLAFSGVSATAAESATDGHHAHGEGAGTPTGSQYYKLDPFVVPVMTREVVARHLTYVVTLELADDSMRDRIRKNLPRLRHALNTSLIQMVGIQRSDGTLPPVAAVKQRMLDVTREVAGKDTVRDLLMESVYERKLQ
jgi:hypothetical protein